MSSERRTRGGGGGGEISSVLRELSSAHVIVIIIVFVCLVCLAPDVSLLFYIRHENVIETIQKCYVHRLTVRVT